MPIAGSQNRTPSLQIAFFCPTNNPNFKYIKFTTIENWEKQEMEKNFINCFNTSDLPTEGRHISKCVSFKNFSFSHSYPSNTFWFSCLLQRFLYFFDPKSVWKIHPFNWQCIGLFSDDINLVIFLAITDNLQSSSCGQFSGNYVYCQSRVLSWTREASTGQSEKAGAPKTKSVASPPSIHRMIPSSGCPCSFPLLTLTGYNVVSCQDLKAHTNTAGSDMFW